MPDSYPRTALYGLFNQKLRWSLSIRGWIVLALVATGLMIGIVWQIYPFLAINQPVAARVLVVEGWAPDYAITASVEEFHKGNYQQLVTAGGPVRSWRYAGRFGGTYAGYAAQRLFDAGLSTNVMITAPAPQSLRNRTYYSAVAVRNRLKESNAKVAAINVLTVGPHARRTRLAYSRAFGPDVTIGIVMVPDQDYDPSHWWKSSAGVREIISEACAYAYSRVNFEPN